MAAYFLASRIGQVNRQSVNNYRDLYVGKPERREAYRLSAVMEHARHAPKNNSYTISIPMQVRAVMVRRVQIIKGDITSQMVQLVCVITICVCWHNVLMPSQVHKYSKPS
jgi:ATP-binding cassette subfamily G (WHITE) protein 2 (SNQ2)